MNEITQLLADIEQGLPNATEQLLPLVYDELRKLAAQRLNQEKAGQTLDATGLVHEVYLRLVLQKQESESTEQQWDSRGHFFAAAAEAMRRILVERARRKNRVKHGGQWQRVESEDVEIADTTTDDEQILLLDEALQRLAKVRPHASELVQLRFFSGLTVEEVGPLLHMSERSARRLWVFARAWLRREMERLDPPSV
jgi:RNA polymerase sigma factor (TIGR02999 family)